MYPNKTLCAEFDHEPENRLEDTRDIDLVGEKGSLFSFVMVKSELIKIARNESFWHTRVFSTKMYSHRRQCRCHEWSVLGENQFSSGATYKVLSSVIDEWQENKGDVK